MKAEIRKKSEGPNSKSERQRAEESLKRENVRTLEHEEVSRGGSQEEGLQVTFVSSIIIDMSGKAQKPISGRDLRRGAREETLAPGESILIEKRSGKLFELKRVDAKPASIVSAVDRIIAEVPVEGPRVKTDLAKTIVEDRE